MSAITETLHHQHRGNMNSTLSVPNHHSQSSLVASRFHQGWCKGSLLTECPTKLCTLTSSFPNNVCGYYLLELPPPEPKFYLLEIYERVASTVTIRSDIRTDITHVPQICTNPLKSNVGIKGYTYWLIQVLRYPSYMDLVAMFTPCPPIDTT